MLAKNLLFFAFFLSFIISACEPNKNTVITQNAFYYWQTVFELDSLEQNILIKSNVQKLYVRFFDVDIDEKGLPKPISTIKFKKNVNTEIIPVIYITNRTLQNLKPSDIKVLSTNIKKKINELCASINLTPTEIQIDCDWSQSTAANYFTLIKELKSIYPFQTLSATIRLHQIKFPELTGVPPVDRGVLMVYNVGKLTDFNTKNSIFDPYLIEPYLDRISDYPIELDIAFPIFKQLVIFRNNRFVTVLRKENYFQIEKLKSFTRIDDSNNYRCQKDTIIANIAILNGDIIRNEVSHSERKNNIEKMILESRKNQVKLTYLYFDLSSENFNNSHDEIPAFPSY